MCFLHPLREAYQSLSTHKARSLSMGFGVLWAIFMLVLLLATGNGFHNGIAQFFAQFGEKTMIIYSNRSLGIDHPIPTAMVANLAQQFDAIQQATPILWHTHVITYKDKKSERYTPIVGLECGYALLAHLPIQEGRFFTAHDEAEASDICVIGLRLKEQLFGKERAIGKYIFLGSKGLQVVGVLDQNNDLVFRQDSVLLTNSFFKKAFPRKSRYVQLIRLVLMPTANAERAEAQCRSYFARHLNFDLKDENALGVFSVARYANKFHKFFNNIATFNWIIGICFLITGMVGISNMMLVTIHERTEEIAIRRVLGARAVEIAALILWEVALVTFMAGIIGFTAGFALLQLLNKSVVPLFKSYYLSRLTCPPEFIFGGLGFIFLASCLASIVPSIRAVKIKPVQALGGKQ